MIKLVVACILFWFVAFSVYECGQYAQFYSTSPNEMYVAIYFEDGTTSYERMLMRLAADYRCDGTLEEDFDCTQGV